MIVETKQSRSINVRAALVIVALLSLCVSNNVGPCFLPLPVVTDGVANNPQGNKENKASRSSSPAESDNFRVPMMAQTQKRSDKAPEAQPVTATPKAAFVPPVNAAAITEFSYQISFATSASVSQPPGRAPPRFA